MIWGGAYSTGSLKQNCQWLAILGTLYGWVRGLKSPGDLETSAQLLKTKERRVLKKRG